MGFHGLTGVSFATGGFVNHTFISLFATGQPHPPHRCYLPLRFLPDLNLPHDYRYRNATAYH